MDPNLLALLVSSIVVIGTWIYHRAKGDKTQTLAQMIGGVADNAIHLIEIKAASHPDEVRADAVEYAWLTLGKLHVPRNATTELLVNSAIEVAVAAAIAKAKVPGSDIKSAADAVATV